MSWGERIAIAGMGPWAAIPGCPTVRAGEDVTFIDFWPAHVEEMTQSGLRITHHKARRPFTVKVNAVPVTEAQHLSKEAPIDIVFGCTNPTTPAGRRC